MELYTYSPKEIPTEVVEEASSIQQENLTSYLTDPFTYINGVVKDNGQIVSIGILRTVSEWKIINNPSASNYKIAKAIKALSTQALKYGSNDIYAIITQGGEYYVSLLERKLGFEKVEGVLLRKDN